MRYDQVFFIIKTDFIGRVLKINSQIALLCLQWQITDFFFLLFPDFSFFILCRKRITRTYFKNVSSLYFLLFLYRWRQIKSRLRLTFRVFGLISTLSPIIRNLFMSFCSKDNCIIQDHFSIHKATKVYKKSHENRF